MTDPFCNSANGARWTDAIGQTATLTYQSKVVVQLATGAGGGGMITFCPDHALVVGTADSYRLDSLVQAPDQGDPNLQNILASGNTSGARIVSAGMTWWNSAPATAGGGYVIATEWSDYRSFIKAGVPNISTSSASQGAQAYVFDRREHGSWISRPSGPNAYNFVEPLVGTNDTEMNRTCVSLAYTGDATSSAIIVEMVINFEIQVSAQSAFARMVKPNPVNPLTIKASKLAGTMESTISPFIKGGKEVVRRAIHSAARATVHRLMQFGGAVVGGYLAGPAGAAAGAGTAGAIMDVD